MGKDAVGIARRRLAGRRGRGYLGRDVDAVGRVQPGAAKIVKFLGRVGDA